MSIKILALETSVEACSAALMIDNSIKQCYEIAPRQHTQLILSMIKSLLNAATITLSELDALAFSCGPGSFTGVRIATSVVQGLAFANDLPVVPVSTLQALAQGVYREFDERYVLAGFDARMSEIYWGAYHLGEKCLMEAVVEDNICMPTAVLLSKKREWVAVGSAWQTYEKELRQNIGSNLRKIIKDFYPQAYDVAVLARSAYTTGKMVSAEEALPIYLRDKTAWRKN